MWGKRLGNAITISPNCFLATGRAIAGSGFMEKIQSRPIATELTRFVSASKHKGA